MVQISTPDIFHPGHLEAVVDAGKHVYCEKPVAVDVTGCKRVMRIGEKVQNRFSLDIGFQCRHAPPYAELARRVHGGSAGKDRLWRGLLPLDGRLLPALSQCLASRTRAFVPSSGIASFPATSLWTRAFIWWTCATGCWSAHPLKAIGTGGRRVKEDAGDCWDHFDVTFTYPNDVHLNLNSFQAGKALSDVGIRLFGAKGVAELHYKGVVGIYGEEPWEWEGSVGPASSRRGARQYLSPSSTSRWRTKPPASSTTPWNAPILTRRTPSLTALPAASFITRRGWVSKPRSAPSSARQAAYRHGETTWEELLASNQSYDPELEGIDLREFE